MSAFDCIRCMPGEGYRSKRREDAKKDIHESAVIDRNGRLRTGLTDQHFSAINPNIAASVISQPFAMIPSQN